MVRKRNSFRTDECVELWIVGESIFLRWIGELNCGDISGNAQKLQPPVNSTSLISAIQSKPAHWDAKIDLPLQMLQDQDAFLLIGRIYGNTAQKRCGKKASEDSIRRNRQGRRIRYWINRRPSQIRKKPTRAQGQLKRTEHEKSSIRAKVEHVFAVVKGRFQYRKTRYRGLRKQTAKLNMLFALANLILADRPCLAA